MITKVTWNSTPLADTQAGLTLSARYCCPILTKIGMYHKFYENSPTNKIQKNLSRGSRVILCGQTDTLLMVR